LTLATRRLKVVPSTPLAGVTASGTRTVPLMSSSWIRQK
jgi:hypothetical protein